MLSGASARVPSERKIAPLRRGLSAVPRTGRPRPLRHDAPDLDDHEQALIAAVCRHDDVASAALYPYLRPSVEGGLLRVLKHPSADFEDLVQETFERVIRTILKGGFHGRCRLTTWTQAIAGNVALDTLRRRAVESRYLAGLDQDAGQPATAPPAERRLEARSSLKLVLDVLSRMNPAQARATVLRHALEYPIESVAHQLGLSTTAAASRIRRAHLELNRRLKLRAVEL